MRNLLKVLLLALGLVTASVFAAESPQMADSHPVDYVVKDGDTLWDIAGKFLKDPWRWKQIWRSNPGRSVQGKVLLQRQSVWAPSAP